MPEQTKLKPCHCGQQDYCIGQAALLPGITCKIAAVEAADYLRSLQAGPSCPLEAQPQCENCETAITGDWNFCPKCGLSFIPAPPADTPATFPATIRYAGRGRPRCFVCDGNPCHCDEEISADMPDSPVIPDSSPDWIEKQVEKLRALKPNWDSYGGATISEAAIKAAVATLRARPQLTPCSNGGVQIDWPDFVELSFGPDGEQEFDAPAVADTTALIDKCEADLRDILVMIREGRYPTVPPELEPLLDEALRRKKAAVADTRDTLRQAVEKFRGCQCCDPVIDSLIGNALESLAVGDDASQLDTREREMELALRNCRMLAQREIRNHEGAGQKPTGVKTFAAWKHILRFCEEAGVTGSILRVDADTPSDTSKEKP